jgi:DNA polymerase-4
VSTANYEARKYGIHSAIPLQSAYKLCPEAVFLPVDYERYVEASHQFKAVLRVICPIIEDVGIDEAFLDISDLPESNEIIADKIKRGIKESTGLTCSIGIAPNKLLAKISSDMQKPDGLTILSSGDIASRIWPLPARKLYGIGPKTETHLKKMNIETIGQVAALSLQELLDHFGNSYGQYLYNASRGIDNNPLVTHWEPRSISRERTFQSDVINWQTIARTIAELTKIVVADMNNDEYMAKTVTIKIRFNDFQTLTRALTLPDYSKSEEEIRKAAFACLKRIDLNKRVRLIGVRVTNLDKTAD